MLQSEKKSQDQFPKESENAKSYQFISFEFYYLGLGHRIVYAKI